MTLPRLTWQQAHQQHLATTQAFTALGINPATIRKWASQGLIHARGKAPGGAHLYAITDVTTTHARPRKKPGRKTPH